MCIRDSPHPQQRRDQEDRGNPHEGSDQTLQGPDEHHLKGAGQRKRAHRERRF